MKEFADAALLSEAHSDPGPGPLGEARRIYGELSETDVTPAALSHSRRYLDAQLEQAAALPSDLPANPADLAAWMEARNLDVGQLYQAYLAERKAGAPRRYFTNRAHAVYFLRSVAPTKLVDGAWLYGVTARWDDPRFMPLIRIYLEELGEGVPARNHVLLYRQLLADNGCDQWEELSDEHFVQGAIQLALARHAAHLLPEVIGFNLGYEQLPLHLPITAYELNELGIDPYYFTLHHTIDNAATGHARRAVESVRLAMPAAGGAAFYRRVANGYLLNEAGKGSQAVIASFDLEQELVGILQRKSLFGKHAHSDYCKVAGRLVSEWLGEPAHIPEFLAALERTGWIRRHQDPANSKFWRLVHGDRGEMFGVFNDYELQTLHDWIAGNSPAPDLPQSEIVRCLTDRAAGGASGLTFRVRQKLLGDIDSNRHGQPDAADFTEALSDDDFDTDTRMLEASLAGARTHRERMAALLPWMAPPLHWRPEGLLATRLFAEAFGSRR